MGLLDALTYAGDSLDKLGARPLRGLLGGKPREALSFLPFSDRVGITDPKDIVSGRNLTDNVGLTRKGDEGFGATALGMGAEMALDPLNLIGGAGAARHAAKQGSALAHSDDLARLSKGLGSLASDADPSLGLKYDHLSTPPSGLSRADPEWVNNRTFYHGTSTPGLNPSNLDPLKTKPKNLYGRGIYTTDEGGLAASNPSITSGYALASHSNGRPNNYRELSNQLYQKWRSIHGNDARYPELRDVIKEFPASFDKPTIYQAQSDFQKILDINEIPPEGLHNRLLDTITDQGFDVPEHFEYHGDETADNYIRHFVSQGINKQQDTNDPLDALIHAIKGEGYDALTHGGGGIVGRRDHQVVIGLDPNDVLGVGRKTPYKTWEPFASLLANDADYSLGDPAKFSPKNIMSGTPDLGDIDQSMLEKAIRYGPRYEGGADNLADFIRPLMTGRNQAWVNQINSIMENRPLADMIGHEIPPGSVHVPGWAGAEAIAGTSPHGVVRFTPSNNPALTSAYRVARPDTPEMLQAFRTANTPLGTVEQLPLTNPIRRSLDHLPSNVRLDNQVSELTDELRDHASDASRLLGDSAERKGLNPWDVHANYSNASVTSEGNAIVHDGGAIRGMTGRPLVSLPGVGGIDRETAELLETLGAPHAVREAVARSAALGTTGQGISYPDGGKVLGLLSELDDRLRSLSPRQSPTVATQARSAAPSADDLIRALTGADLSAGPQSPLAQAVSSGGGGLDTSFRDLRSQFKMHKNVPLRPGMPSGVQGLYKPSHNAGAVFQGARNPGATARHEVGHGIVDQAVKRGAGSVAGLPLAWQPGAWAKLAGTPGGGVHSFGRYLDEIAQHSTQNRGLMNQVRGGVNFATDRRVATRYADHLAADNPLLKALIMTAPWASENRGSLALGALGGAELAKLSAALQREEQ